MTIEKMSGYVEALKDMQEIIKDMIVRFEYELDQCCDVLTRKQGKDNETL